jgi:hypothetical protein
MDSKCCGDQTGLCPAQPLHAGLSTGSASGEETHQAKRVGGLQSVQPRQRFKEDFVYMFTFPDFSNTGILKTIFT